jgi:NADPH:quinone reductase-like Zn-dependent oxidoreductase
VRSASRHEQVASLGAKVVPADGFVEAGPFDVILETIGGPNILDDIESLAHGGRIAVLGVAGGPDAAFPLPSLMGKGGRIFGSMMRPRSRVQIGEAVVRAAKDILPLLAARKLGVPIQAVFALEEADAAYEAFAAGDKVGKIVLVIA